jgi:hypothetical protein
MEIQLVAIPQEVQKQTSKKMETYYHYYSVQRFHQIENCIQNLNNLQAGLSYRASGGLLAGEPGGRAGGPVHYALYEPGGVL